MKRIALLLITIMSVQAADVLTVDPSATVVITGMAPAVTALGEVRMGGGVVDAGKLVRGHSEVNGQAALVGMSVGAGSISQAQWGMPHVSFTKAALL